MSTVTYHCDLNEVQSDADLARLLSATDQTDPFACAPFDKLAWWEGLARHCALDSLFAVASNAQERAVLALRDCGNRELGPLSNWYTFRFRPLATDPALLDDIARDLPRRARRVTLSGIPDEDGSATLLEKAFRKAGWVVLRTQGDINHVLETGGRDYATYLAGRPGKLRTTLKRKAGKLETQIFTHFDPQAWNDYEAIYAESWKPEEGSPEFLRAFAEAEGAAGRLRLGIARAEGEAIAAQLWTLEGGTAWIHKLAYRESTRALSPGSVLTAALMRHVIDIDRATMVDFGTGDDPYKRDWMESQRPRFRLDMLRPSSPRNWPLLARAAFRAGQAALAARAKRR